MIGIVICKDVLKVLASGCIYDARLDSIWSLTCKYSL